ncbi:MAG: hypothetical protein JJ969_14685 [Rhizobiaceae bacterium]|jgi:hypothetical protein|nr:hypothetical protein [Rhizobiaceae bacterium]
MTIAETSYRQHAENGRMLRAGTMIAAAFETMAMLAAALLLVATPLVLHLLHPAAGIFAALLLAGICAGRMPHVALVAIPFGFLFQNLIVSLLANQLSTADFDIIRGYNFLTLASVWLVTAARFLTRWEDRNRLLDPYVKFSVAILFVIGVYFIYGYIRTEMTAVIYLRNIVTPLLLFQICLVLFEQQQIRIGAALSGLAVLAILFGFTEFLNREFWLAATNGRAYWELAGDANWVSLAYDKSARESGHVVTGLVDTFRIAAFNSPLLADFEIEVLRLFGPNMHAISFAYALSFLSIFCLYRARFGLAALLFVLMVLCNAKGPLIVFLLVAAGWTIFRLLGARLGFMATSMALAAYAVLGILVGLDIEDYHVLGLMAGLSDFPLNPVGWGIGSGGNLSPDFNTIDWSAAQGDGRTPFAVESSVAVLLHQMGIFAFGIIAFYAWVAWRVMRLARITDDNLHAAAALGLMCMVVNGLFQEEAYFAPLALALFLGLAGMILGAAARNRLSA